MKHNDQIGCPLISLTAWVTLTCAVALALGAGQISNIPVIRGDDNVGL
jgi:hypothetical protein